MAIILSCENFDQRMLKGEDNLDSPGGNFPNVSFFLNVIYELAIVLTLENI